MDQDDITLVRSLKEKGIKVITILISGRLIIIGDVLPYSDALIAAWLPGTEGGGIADILFGDFPPTGKLSHSWPAYMEQVPINMGDPDYNPLFSYKFGLDQFPTAKSGQTEHFIPEQPEHMIPEMAEHL